MIKLKRKILALPALVLVALLGFAGGAAAQVVTYPVYLTDVLNFGTALNYFHHTPSVRKLNFLDGAAFNDTTRAIEIGGLLDVGPTTLPTAVASAATITPPTTGNVFHVTGTTQITTINSPFGTRSGCITMIPDGLWSTGTSGNIALGSTAVVSRGITECYDPTTAKWYPSY